MYNKLFEVSDEDTYILVYRYFAELINGGENIAPESEDNHALQFLKTCIEFHEKGENEKLLMIISQHINFFIEKEPEDFENCLRIISYLFAPLRFEDTKDALEEMTKAIISQNSYPLIRIRCLLQLYNTVPYQQNQYTILTKIIKFATESGQSNLLVPILRGKVDKLLSKWANAPQAIREIYFLFSALFRMQSDDKEVAKEGLDLITKALALIEASDYTSIRNVAPQAAEALSDFIRQTDIYSCDLLDLPAVKALQKNPPYVSLHNLFSVIVKGDIKKIESVCQPELLNKLSVTKEHCLEKARMTALLNMCRASALKPVPFQDFQSILDLDQKGVEFWIVKAVGEGLLDARIDQYKNEVSVNSCANKSFEKADWKHIAVQLEKWKSLLNGVEGMISETLPSKINSKSAY